jgi:hypothetical protein
MLTPVSKGAMMTTNDLDCTRKLTMIANTVHGEKEIMWAMRATDLILALWDIRESFVRLRNDGDTEPEVLLGENGYEIVKRALDDYGLTDLLETVA